MTMRLVTVSDLWHDLSRLEISLTEESDCTVWQKEVDRVHEPTRDKVFANITKPGSPVKFGILCGGVLPARIFSILRKIEAVYSKLK